MSDVSQVHAKPFLTRRVSIINMIKKHILVVDDDSSLRALFQALLESYGYTSETAANGWEALTRIAQAPFDTVLLDYMMPGITGLAVLQYMQRHHPSIPVLMLTGHAEGPVAAQALAAGARVCLSKPFNCAELKEALNSMVEMNA